MRLLNYYFLQYLLPDSREKRENVSDSIRDGKIFASTDNISFSGKALLCEVGKSPYTHENHPNRFTNP